MVNEKMSLLIAILYHRELWTWLAKHPGASKEEWPGWNVENPYFDMGDGISHSYCFACMVTGCAECLFVWGSYENRCCRRGSPYLLWAFDPESEGSSELALEISKLPVNPVYLNRPIVRKGITEPPYNYRYKFI